ncbi:MAG: hypothetical protein AB3N22_17335 [Ruegeria sp.]
MLNILSTLLGPHRAVSVYAFLQTRGLAVLGGLFLAAIIGVLYMMGSDDEHRHEAFMTVPVLSATAIGGDLANGVIASVRLPDGSAASLNSTEGQIAQTVGTTACIEKRIYVNSGEPRYRLKLPHNCTDG